MQITLRRGAEIIVSKKQTKDIGTFVVRILDRKNATWQGSVTWTEQQNVQYFRSALELLKLIDGALDEFDENKEEGGSQGHDQ